MSSSRSKRRGADRPPRPAVEGRTVVVLHEKHGQLYFVVDNDAELHAVALSVVKGRLKSDWYYEPEPPQGKPDYTEESIPKLPESMRGMARDKLRRYKDELRSYESEKALWDLLQWAVKEEDGSAAWRVLKDRGDYEYERVSLERARESYS